MNAAAEIPEDQLDLLRDGVTITNPAMLAMKRRADAKRKKRKARTPAERKRDQKAREEALGVKRFEMRLAHGERERIAQGARARGYQDHTEYLVRLVLEDLGHVKREGAR